MSFGMVFTIILLTIAALGLLAMIYDLARFIGRRIGALIDYFR